MIVVVLLTIATGAVLLWTLYTEQVPPPRSRAHSPRWTGLPDAADIRRRDFPLALAGYDPDAVDAHLRAVSAAFVAVRDRLASAAADAPPTQADAPLTQADAPLTQADAPPTRADAPSTHADAPSTGAPPDVVPTAAEGGRDGDPPAATRPPEDDPWAPPPPPVREPDERTPAPRDGSLGSISDD